MAKRKKNQSGSEVTNSASDTEFGSEVPQSKKARKRAVREKKNNG